MQYLFAAVVPTLFLLSFAYAAKKKVNVFHSFTTGMQGAVPLVLSVFPYIAAVTMLNGLLAATGLDKALCDFLSPIFRFFGMPAEIAPLLLVKPLSGSGSIAVLSEILATYGVDGYIGRCACVAYGSGETVFYIGAVYFAGLKRKKLSIAVGICLLSYFIACLFCCFLCRFL